MIFGPDPLVADIYRSVDDEGRVTFSDQAMPGAEAIAPAASQAVYGLARRDDLSASVVGDPGPYEAFAIATPSDNAVIESDDGRLDLGLLLIPSLMPGQRLRLLVDGQPVESGNGRTQLSLRRVSLGTHQLQARILDEAGATVAATATIAVHMRSAPTAGRESSR